MQQTSLNALKNLLRTNVCEIEFFRRRPKEGRSMHRKMMCTLCIQILDSVNGRMSLNYRPPTHLPPYHAESKNLLFVWDIMMQDWRAISLDVCYIINTIPGNDEFWKYFNEKIYPMSPEQKLSYMDL